LLHSTSMNAHANPALIFGQALTFGLTAP